MAHAFFKDRRKIRRINKQLELALRRVSIRIIEYPAVQDQNFAKHDHDLLKRAESLRIIFRYYERVYAKIRRIETDWRCRVYTNEEPYSSRIDQIIRKLHAIWFAYSSTFISEAESLHRRGVITSEELKGIVELRAAANSVIGTWQPPRASTAPSFRPVTLSHEAVARVKELFPGSI